MTKYIYKGPVMEFGRCVANCWEATTCAKSINKARNNLTYRYKKEHGIIATANIVLTGKIMEV